MCTGSITSPCVIVLNIKTPSTAKMKYTKVNSANTLSRDGNEKVIVCINA